MYGLLVGTYVGVSGDPAEPGIPATEGTDPSMTEPPCCTPARPPVRLNRRGAELVLPVILLTLLTGCLEVKENLWIEPDGRGRLHLDIGLAADGTAPDADGLVESEVVEDLRRAAGPLAGDPRLTSSPVVSWYTRDGFNRAEIDIQVADWHDLPAIGAAIIERTCERVPEAAGYARLLTFSLEEDEEGVIWFSQPPSPLTSFTPPGAGGRLTARYPAEDLARFFDQARLTVTLHSPMVSSTNGHWMLDKESVQWTLALSAVRTSRQGETAFTARIGASARSSHFLRTLLIVAAVSLLVATLTWFQRRRHRRRMERGQAPQ